MTEKLVKDFPELAELLLFTTFCDGEYDLHSLKLRTIIASGEIETDESVPNIRLSEHLGNVPHDEETWDSHETRAAIEAGLDPDDGFPGWHAIYDYIEKHPLVL